MPAHSLQSPSRTSAPSHSPALLDAGELLRQICVRAPYFALTGLVQTAEGALRAWVPVEQSPGDEASPISAAEAGRHLAILGSCAAALRLSAGAQHFYLAQEARLTRLHSGPMGRASGLLVGEAQASFTGRRSARATCTLSTPGGEPLFALDVTYAVLAAPLFQRLHADARVEMRRADRPRSEADVIDFAALRRNPFAQPLPLGPRTMEGETLSASLTVAPELCKGHFALYPVLPVAAAMSGLANVAGERLAQVLGVPSVRHLVVRGDVTAERLAQTGEQVTFSAAHEGSRGGEHHFRCVATSTKGPVARMALVLAPAGPGSA